MGRAERLITEHLDLWSSAIKAKPSAGRGANKKLELYGISKLRELILDLAVRGMLVEQNPEDAPASSLLKQAAIEKDQLVKDKRIKKQKPLRQITKEREPYQLPVGWEWEQMGNLSTQITDGTHHTPEYINSGVPFISVKDIDGRRISFRDCKYISQEQHVEINARCNPQLGDILICRIGTLGRATIVDTERAFSLFVSVGLIKFPQHLYTPRFAHLALHSPLLIKQYEKIKAGGSHTNKLNLRDLPKLLLPVAPLAEQHRIVAKVDELMALCDQLEEEQENNLDTHETLVSTFLNALTSAAADASQFADSWQRIQDNFDILFTTASSVDQLKQTILQLAVMGKLVPQDPEDEPSQVLLGRIATERARLIKEKKIKNSKCSLTNDALSKIRIPTIWQLTTLGNVADWGSGSTPKRENQNHYGGSLTWLKSGELNDCQALRGSSEKITEEAVKAGSFRRNIIGDILIAMYGATIGKVAILDETAYTNQAVCGCTPFDGVFNRYLFFYLISQRKNFHAASEGGAQPNISKVKLLGYPLPLPPLAEQHRIVAKVDELFTLCDHLKARLYEVQKTQLTLADSIVERAIHPPD